MQNLTFASLRGTRTAIHCPTQLDWDKTSEICARKWENAKWEHYQENSCIDLKGNAFGNINSFENYTIIPAADFIAANSGEVEPEPISKDVVNMLLWISKTFDLASDIWYWKEDEDGDNPLTETDLIKLWREHKLTAIGQIKAKASKIGK